MKKHVKNNVSWVGKVDWDLQTFHGEEYSTHRGTTYNSYLIEEEKTVLIDGVHLPFAKEYVDNLASEIDLESIDFIVMNHAEMDHSGSLPALMEKIPNTPIYCSANGLKSIKGQFHQDWDLRPLKMGDELDLGNGKKLIFVEMKMLHWPDSMAAYMTQDNILFSNDAFGQHYATDRLFNDLVDPCELEQEALKYYANILTPYAPILKKKLAEIMDMKLDIDMIATSHGVIWRDKPLEIVEKYASWVEGYQEDQVSIIYDTMWEGTKKLAEAIAAGVRQASPDTLVKVYNRARTDENDLITEIFKSKMVLLGSPTINRGILHDMAGFIQLIEEMKFKKKKAAAFGCYGWSGESVKIVSQALEEAGFEVLSEGLRCDWSPDEDQVREGETFGAKLMESFK